MKKRFLIIVLIVLFLTEAAALLAVLLQEADGFQDTIAVNEVLQWVQRDFSELLRGKETEDGTGDLAERGGSLSGYAADGGKLDFVVLSVEGTVIFKTREGLSESIHEAARHRDTLLDVEVSGQRVGTLIVNNDSGEVFEAGKKKTVAILAGTMFFQCVVCIGYVCYLERRVIRPFQKLRGFAERIAGGNLDIPLEMDRGNLFGAFTEGFDLMRSELRRARIAEKAANDEKKELTAKLSHDIRTPVASIKAASEVGAALTDDKKLKENYEQIIRKADQINTLVSNLFTATLEELSRLSVTPSDMESNELSVILENADYLHRAELPKLPSCLLYADRLRLQQVFDNLFANSYKYAGTKIIVTAGMDGRFLVITIEDLGGGVAAEELPLLKEKFRRGKNAQDASGAGLGLYISDHFMREMEGALEIENGKLGLKATVRIALSGNTGPSSGPQG